MSGLISRIVQLTHYFTDCIVAPPTITKQPTSKTVSVLQNVTFICEAEGFRVKYKWKRHGTIRSASTSQSRLTITQIVPSDAGHYVCIVRTEGGKVAFRIATLTVNGKITVYVCVLHTWYMLSF